ncbi:glycosyltransferase [Cupriavidus pauculus]|uniref:glycosyltransferase n=1 Tax=Cupriavidus pauculus TaxID=82633 RepID=UPI001EE28713|nr:glycosyltransferase [Cupriavidus pauculus]GJG93497.1 glycosyltransferase [Cupriavidus pauculus]
MRILFVTTGLRMGGAEQQVSALAREFLERGHRVALISLTPDCEVPMPDAVERLMLDMRKTPLSMARTLVIAHDFARKWQPDIVNSHMFHANVFARVLARFTGLPPLICAAHSFSEGGKLRMTLYRLTNHWCALTTQVSETSLEEMVRAHAVTRDRVRVMYNGIDTVKFQPDGMLRDQTRAQLGIESGTRVIINIGRLAAEKAQVALVDAFQRLDRSVPTRLLIAGDGPQRQALASRIAHHGLQDSVQLLGTRHDIPALLNAADLFALSSRVEGMPLVLAEALACECPVVSTAAPGVAELLGELGTIVPLDDADALAHAMHRSLTTEDRASAQRQIGRARIIKHFGIAAAADRWLELYGQITGAAHNQAGHAHPCADA